MLCHTKPACWRLCSCSVSLIAGVFCGSRLRWLHPSGRFVALFSSPLPRSLGLLGMLSPSSAAPVAASSSAEAHEVLGWLGKHFPESPLPSPSLSVTGLVDLLGLVRGRHLEWELEMRRLRMVENFLVRHLHKAHNRAMSAVFAVPADPDDAPLAASELVVQHGSTSAGFPLGSSLTTSGASGSVSPVSKSSSRTAATSPSAVGLEECPDPPSSVAGASVPRVSGKAAALVARSRTRSPPPASLCSTSAPPVGFDVNDHGTWGSDVPSDWCRACWPEARGLRFNKRHEKGVAGRRCRLASTPDLRPAKLLFGFVWQSAKQAASASAGSVP